MNNEPLAARVLIVGARYDATEIATGATEVLAYGTAVIVEPTDAGETYRS